jgi:uncharacterized membrane protein YqjE
MSDLRPDAVGPDPGVDLRVEPLEPDRSLGELASEMTGTLSDIFRKEVELAKVELKEEAAKAGKGAGMLGGAGVAAHMALLLVSFALAFWLDEIVHTALAFLIVGVLYAIAAAVMAKMGQRHFKEATPPMPNTVASLKEDAQWARAQKS